MGAEKVMGRANWDRVGDLDWAAGMGRDAEVMIYGPIIQ
jgi:hypothetical protein